MNNYIKIAILLLTCLFFQACVTNAVKKPDSYAEYVKAVNENRYDDAVNLAKSIQFDKKGDWPVSYRVDGKSVDVSWRDVVIIEAVQKENYILLRKFLELPEKYWPNLHILISLIDTENDFSNESKKIINLLINKGLDISATNKSGLTILCGVQNIKNYTFLKSVGASTLYNGKFDACLNFMISKVKWQFSRYYTEELAGLNHKNNSANYLGMAIIVSKLEYMINKEGLSVEKYSPGYESALKKVEEITLLHEKKGQQESDYDYARANVFVEKVKHLAKKFAEN